MEEVKLSPRALLEHEHLDDYVGKHYYLAENVKCELYYRLRLLKIPVTAEHKISMTGQKSSRIDLVVHDFKKIKVLIEVKGRSSSYTKKYKDRKKEMNTKQVQRYKSYGIPVVVCNNMDDIPRAIDEIRSHLLSK